MADDITGDDAATETPSAGDAGSLGAGAGSSRPQRGWGCLAAVLAIFALIIGGLWGLKAYQDAKERDAIAVHEQQVEQELVPMAARLTETVDKEAPYDIDKTIRVIHEIDEAVKESKDLKAYIQQLGKQDYRNVAPDVLEARKELMDIILRLYARQVALEDQEAMWDVTSEMMLTVMSAVEVDSGVGGLPGALVTGQFSVDKEKFEEALAETKERHADQRKLMADLRAVEQEFLKAMLKYSEVYYKYVEEWDRVCVYRDRAYLATHNSDWDQAVEASDAAIQVAPYETEAHLLKAMALIEQGKRPEQEQKLVEASTILNAYIKDHPDSTAPAFLLLGVLNGANGNDKEARLSLQQSAAYYPKQSEHLNNMLNPYKMRDFLRKSREGGYIVELYKGTMLGAGYFSPDLQMARTLFEAGDFEAGRGKVLDHFSRRRAQAQWDFVISDLEFCERFLGVHWRRIFPEEPYLDLVVDPSLLGSSLSVSVVNRSNRTLHNATLVLAVRFTDMHREDYETFTVGRTVPAIAANDETDFGDVEIKRKIFGKEKTTGDIVQHRAILVTDEAVSWVDTDQYKIAELKELRQQRWYQESRAQQDKKGSAWLKALGVDQQQFKETLQKDSALKINPELGRDSVTVEVPAELALLRPLFRLVHGDQTFSPEVNVLDTENIQLTFKSVENFESKDLKDLPIELTVDGLFGDYKLIWTKGEDGKFTLTAVE